MEGTQEPHKCADLPAPPPPFLLFQLVTICYSGGGAGDGEGLFATSAACEMAAAPAGFIISPVKSGDSIVSYMRIFPSGASSSSSSSRRADASLSISHE